MIYEIFNLMSSKSTLKLYFELETPWKNIFNVGEVGVNVDVVNDTNVKPMDVVE